MKIPALLLALFLPDVIHAQGDSAIMTYAQQFLDPAKATATAIVSTVTIVVRKDGSVTVTKNP